MKTKPLFKGWAVIVHGYRSRWTHPDYVMPTRARARAAYVALNLPYFKDAETRLRKGLKDGTMTIERVTINLATGAAAPEP